LILVGFMGTGKSSIGRLVAKRIGFQFMDTDHHLESREGKSVAKIFSERGEAAFRDLETRTIESLAHLTRCVIATGGGAVLREENRRLLRELGFVVALSAAPEVIYERVARNDKRPLVQTENPRETIKQLLAARAEHYREAAQFTLDTSTIPHAEAAEKIIAEARRAFSWHH
jgi:shikimate kinase